MAALASRVAMGKYHDLPLAQSSHACSRGCARGVWGLCLHTALCLQQVLHSAAALAGPRMHMHMHAHTRTHTRTHTHTHAHAHAHAHAQAHTLIGQALVGWTLARPIF